MPGSPSGTSSSVPLGLSTLKARAQRRIEEERTTYASFSQAGGARVQLSGTADSPDAQWRISSTSNGSFTVESVGTSGKFLSSTQTVHVHAEDDLRPESLWRIFRLGRPREDNTTYLGCFGESQLPADKTRVPESGTYVEMRARAEGGPSDKAPVEVEFFNLSPEPMEVWLDRGNGSIRRRETA
ncbi:unnamed protein product [Prorocentrum cordatum]|uniref:Uncharacterized protein n=1 Tax=Prorocentrum cordatum TaxID=2364126 RepID=A0ABN9XZU1_9DINO|nr:unnamed protein product [Polarella glacialis]